jgi:hypothetical protein
VHTLEQLRNGALAGLRRVELTGASTGGLSSFPRELFDLADHLEVLDLSGNQLTELPADLGRLHRLQALFCSGNPFQQLPPALGGCAALSQVGFRGCNINHVPAEALPAGLRWLTLTDNHLSELPAALFDRPALQKLMLAGNRLHALPATLARARRLELLRLSANHLSHLPPELAELPRLAWLAWAGNPVAGLSRPAPVTPIHWQDLHLGALLGEGASGRVHAAQWQGPLGPHEVAVKLFRGQMTSDGLPAEEMAACLAVGDHPLLLGARAPLAGHPQQLPGLVMSRLPGHWRALAQPPSLASCTRDVHAPDLRWHADALLKLMRQVAGAASHLHTSGWLHGDLYAHNVLWDPDTAQAVLSDLGAASPLPAGAAAARWQRLDVLAWGILLGELLAACPSPPAALQSLQAQCTQTDPAQRPLMSEVLADLGDVASRTG